MSKGSPCINKLVTKYSYSGLSEKGYYNESLYKNIEKILKIRKLIVQWKTVNLVTMLLCNKNLPRGIPRREETNTVNQVL